MPIARLWRGQVDGAANADAYARHFTQSVVPALETMPGHQGAWLLRREVGGRTEFLALTLWASRQSIEAFTGSDIDRAIVEPEAQAVLESFDDFATHYEVESQVRLGRISHP
jgi:heme-degrading monooxygenase HmoA